MIYNFILFLLLFTTSLFSEASSTTGNNNFIKTSLEFPLSSINKDESSFNLIVKEDYSLSQVTIPKGTKITCNKSVTKTFGESTLIFSSCNKMYLPNNQRFDIRGSIFTENLNEGILINKNTIFPKDSPFLIKITSVNNNNVYKDTIIKVSLVNSFSPINATGDDFNLITEEYIYDSSYRTILIPKGTKITCKQENVEISNNRFIITSYCNHMVLPDGTLINIQGEVYDKTGHNKFSLGINENALKNMKLTLKLKQDIDF